MPDRSLRLFILGDSSSAESAFGRTAAAAEASEAKLGGSGATAGDKFAAGIDSGTTKAGNSLERLGNSLGNWGLPFSNQLSKIGNDLSNVETRGKGLGEAMSATGAVIIAGLVGVGAESVHLSDQFEKQQSALETSVKNSGNSFGAYKIQVDAAEQGGTKFGATATDVAGALAGLTTATDNPTKALGLLNTAEEISVGKHESLATATGQLEKILGGSTRTLTQFGINLDVGASKLHSIQSAEESLQRAHLGLNATQAEVNSGQLKGAEGAAALAKDQLQIRDDTLNLSQSQQAQADILATLNQRFKDAGEIYGQTLPGQIGIANAKIHDAGIAFGSDLTKGIHDGEIALASIFTWFQKNKGVAEILGGTLVTVGAAAVAVFTYDMGVKLVTGLERAGTGMFNLAKTSLEQFGIIDGAAEESAAVQTQAGVEVIAASEVLGTAQVTVSNETIASLATQGRQWAAFAAEVQVESANILASTGEIDVGLQEMASNAQAQSELYVASLDAMGITTAETAAAIATSEGAIEGAVTTADAGIIGANEAAGASFTAMLGPIGLVAGALGALYEIEKPTSLQTNDYGTPAQGAQEIATMKKDGASAATIKKTISDLNADYGSGKEVGRLSSTGQLIDTGPSPTSGGPITIKTPGSTIPSLGSIPSVSGLGGGGGGGGSTTPAGSSIESSGNSLLTSLQDAITGNTVSTLIDQTNATAKAAMDTLTTKLVADGVAADKSLAAQIVAAFQAAQVELAQDMINQQNIADADLLNSQAAGVQAQTAAVQAGTQTEVASIQAASTAMTDGAATQTADIGNASALVADQAKLQTTLIGDSAAKMADSIQASATEISDVAKIISDQSAQQVGGINSDTTAGNDTASAQVQAINDQTTLTVDALNERGKYGLELVAQQDQVILDQQTATDHQLEAAAQAHLDQITAQGSAQVLVDQTALDSVTAQDNAKAASLQQSADTVTIATAISVGDAQASLDRTTMIDNLMVGNIQARADALAQVDATKMATAQGIENATNITTALYQSSAAQMNDAAATGSALQQATAAAAGQLLVAQGNAASIQAAAALEAVASLQSTDAADSDLQIQTAKDTAARDAANAQAGLQQSQSAADEANANAAASIQINGAQAAQQQAAAAAQLSADQNQLAYLTAVAQQGLANVTNAANLIEAKDSQLAQIASAQAATEFGGGGTVIYISGIPLDNAAAVTNAVDWGIRTAVPTPVGS